MAGQQFLTPKPVRPSRRSKRFTLAEANRALPLVRRVVEDIVKRHERVTSLQAAVLAALPADRDAAQKDLDHRIEDLQSYVDELREIGCDLKDYQTGLVDFIGRHQGRDVCLCWKLGEQCIEHWHEMHSGFAGRQPVSVLQETE